MGDERKDWLIRRKGKIQGLFTESQLRRRLVSSTRANLEVRQGRSAWFPAEFVLAKFKELVRTGVYLRRKTNETGPFTTQRAIEILLRSERIGEMQARIGLDGKWFSASALLVHLQSMIQSTNRDLEPNRPPAPHHLPHPPPLNHKFTPSQPPSRPHNRSSKTLRSAGPAGELQLNCPRCRAVLHVGSLPTDGVLDCPNCQQSMRVLVPKPMGREQSKASLGVVHQTPPHNLRIDKAPIHDQRDESLGGHYPRLPRRRKQAKYVVPGILIALWGCLLLLGSFMGLMGGMAPIVWVAQRVFPSETVLPTVLRIIMLLAWLPASVIMILGSVSMIWQRHLPLARCAAALASIPLVGCLVMPIGLWGCWVLFSPKASRDFT